MRKRKRQFHCERCHSPCEIYKKGKNHRVLVCPMHGVIATNPGPLIAAAARIIGPMIAEKAISKLTEGKTEKDHAPSTPRAFRESYSTEERVRDALAR